MGVGTAALLILSLEPGKREGRGGHLTVALSAQKTLLQAAQWVGPHLEIDDSIGPKAFHGEELQVPLEVLGIKAGNGEPIAKASLQGARRRR